MNKNIDIRDVWQKGRLNKHRIEMGITCYCPACGVVLDQNKTQVQYAHYMSQGKQSRKKHGDKYIDHIFNGCYVCSLKCNNDVQIDRQPELILELKLDIDNDINS